jgi:hypothetical protein
MNSLPAFVQIYRHRSYYENCDEAEEHGVDEESSTHAFAYASDGRAIASVAQLNGGPQAGYGIHWIAAPSDTPLLADLVTAPRIGDPGTSIVGGQASTGVSPCREPQWTCDRR